MAMPLTVEPEIKNLYSVKMKHEGYLLYKGPVEPQSRPQTSQEDF